MIALVAAALIALAAGPGTAGDAPPAAPAAAAAGAVPAGTPTAAELVARNRAAKGPEGEGAEHETWAVRSGGLDGTLEVLKQGGDSSSTLLLGPFRTARGTIHGQRWHQNDNGETVLERPEPSQIERVATESVSRVREPADAWLVATTYAGGHALRTYYDPRSYLVVRAEKTAGGRTTRTTYDDFRPDARGRLRATHFFGNDDRAGSDFDYRLVRETRPTLVHDELAVPPDRRPLVEFPAGITTVRLPARIERGRVYVRVTIGTRALDFLLDSGAANVTLDEGVARNLGLASYGRTAETAAGTFTAQRVVVPALGIGALALHNVVLRTGPIAENEGTHTRVVGLLGFDFLAAVGLKVDYSRGTVDAYRPQAWAPPPQSVPLAVRLNAQVPVTTATVGEATGDDFILDTGAQFDLVLFARFMRAHGSTAAEVMPDLRYGNGVGGEIPYRPLAVKRVTLGPLEFADPAAALALPPAALGFDSKDGIVGSGLLGRFSVYFDYAAGRVYLGPPSRPGTAGGEPELRHRRSGEPESVKHVRENGF